MIKISAQLAIPATEIELQAIRAQGAGGQNVNKVSSAIHLRFVIGASSLPDEYKERLRHVNDRRISGDGVIVIKAQRYRSQEKNRQDALARLQELIIKAGFLPKKRIATQPDKKSERRRLADKVRLGNLKTSRLRIRHPPRQADE